MSAIDEAFFQIEQGITESEINLIRGVLWHATSVALADGQPCTRVAEVFAEIERMVGEHSIVKNHPNYQDALIGWRADSRKILEMLR